MVWKMTWGIWQIFTRALKSLKKWDSHEILQPKQKTYDLKIYRGVMCGDDEEWCKIWKGIDLSFQNWHEEYDKFKPKYSIVSRVLNGFLLTKVCNVWVKKVQRSYGWWDWTLDWFKIWRKTGLRFPKWQEEFGKFSQSEK